MSKMQRWIWMFVLSGYETDYENVILSELNDYF